MSLRRRGKIKRILITILPFLLGLLVGGGGIFFYNYYNEKQLEAMEEKLIKAKVLAVNRDILSGELVSEEDLVELEVDERVVPKNYILSKEEALGKKAMVLIKENTIIGESFFYEDPDDELKNLQDIRLDYIPSNLEEGMRLDLRIQFPTGHDYCILSNKKLHRLDLDAKSIFLALNEGDRVRLSSAQADKNYYEGVRLYISSYPIGVDLVPTLIRYPVNGSVEGLYSKIDPIEEYQIGRKDLEHALGLLAGETDKKFLESSGVSSPIDDIDKTGEEVVPAPAPSEKELGEPQAGKKNQAEADKKATEEGLKIPEISSESQEEIDY